MSCDDSTRKNCLVKIVERITASEKLNYHNLGSLCPGANKATCKNCILSLLTFLNAFDALEIINGKTTNDSKLKVKSKSSLFFLRSFIQYIKTEKSLLLNRDHQGVLDEITATNVFNGSQFVYLMEKKRVIEHGDLTPIRKAEVAKVLVKSKIQGRFSPSYLVQYDVEANQFQLIGGSKKGCDRDLFETAKREVAEELKYSSFKYPRDYDLRELYKCSFQVHSSAYGAYSEYDVIYYQAIFNKQNLILGPHDRWITKKELLSGITADGYKVFNGGIQKLNEHLSGGLDSLPLSSPRIQSRPIMDIIKEKKIELIGSLITLAGIIVTIMYSK